METIPFSNPAYPQLPFMKEFANGVKSLGWQFFGCRLISARMSIWAFERQIWMFIKGHGYQYQFFTLCDSFLFLVA